jgi:hypothetical protein
MATPQIRRPAGRTLLDAADKTQSGMKPLMLHPSQIIYGAFYHKNGKLRNSLWGGWCSTGF